MPLRRLPESLVNRIAAGEVLERPASAVKELVENSLDAAATRIVIFLDEGGKRQIRVEDDGHGMTREELPLAIERHATSKLDDDDLMRISHLGFRGEALAALGATGRLSVSSRARGAPKGWRIRVEGGEVSEVEPCATQEGTTVSLSDIFFATPARLKFLRSAQSEGLRTREVLQALALAHPAVSFSLEEAGRRSVSWPACRAAEASDRLRERIAQILGTPFAENASPVEAEGDTLRLSGFACLPTYRRGNGGQIFFLVNGRPVRDRLLLGVLRAAYQDVLPRGSYPAAVLFLDLSPEEVDVNVHPAKSEVRFHNPGAVRALLLAALSRMLAATDRESASTLADAVAAGFSRNTPSAGGFSSTGGFSRGTPLSTPTPPRPGAQILSDYGRGQAELAVPMPPHARDASATLVSLPTATTGVTTDTDGVSQATANHPLGAARAQLHATYIVAETEDGVVIVDQHAADERLVYESLKRDLARDGVARQILLVPEIVELAALEAERLLAQRESLEKVGLVLEPFGGTGVLVREIPALLNRENLLQLIRGLADAGEEASAAAGVEERLHHIMATFACHGSIRAGRRLSLDEMNRLLRSMEATPHSGQCNHGRPSYVKLGLGQLNRLFERSG